MSHFQHNGWTTKSLSLLAQAKKLKKQLEAAGKAEADDSAEIKALEKEKSELEGQLSALKEKIYRLRTDTVAAKRKDLGHIQEKINALNEQAKAELRSVPPRILEFLTYISNGINYSAGFQIVWYNQRFVILRLPGRKFFGGIGRRAYANAETQLYDLDKFSACRKDGKGRRGFGSLEMKRHCLVKEVEGRISAKTMQEWKEECEFVAT